MQGHPMVDEVTASDGNVIQEIKDILSVRNLCEVERIRRRMLGQSLSEQNEAAIRRVRLESKAGRLLRDKLRLRGGDRRTGASGLRVRIRDLGITHSTSSRLQAVGEIPDKIVDEVARSCDECERMVTTKGLVEFFRASRRERRSRDIVRAVSEDT